MKRLLSILLVLLPLLAAAQQEMEILPLRHRTVDQVLPVLRPLLEPGAALSGMNNQLILRASRKNRDEIRQALAALDTPARSLRILVSQHRDAEMRQSGAEAYGSVGSGNVRIIQPPSGVAVGGGRVEIRRDGNVVGGQVVDTRSTRAAGAMQSVQVVEGGRAYISVGQSLPLPLRQVVVGPGGAVVTETVVYRDVGQGFYAEPRLAGDRVTLEISPQFDTPGAAYGSINTQRLSTTVSGRLGEWIELGGSGQQAAGRERGGFSVGTSEIRDDRSIWLKVEEVQ
ncbi:secretin N-terminal domain-containing protein [Azospira restricta]|uniref:secretin N-terminal domain-containing protein n=1 Tax=Azospira restricta TaxID=404405 RepID=UPI00193AEDA2|nr:secretin N-terminal domain-containing protein [Azospira restricta]